jgi:hypothetical protein
VKWRFAFCSLTHFAVSINILHRSIVGVMLAGGRIAMRTEVAFAIAGLGGVNAHGAGFLDAANKNGVVPDLVTATGG